MNNNPVERRKTRLALTTAILLTVALTFATTPLYSLATYLPIRIVLLFAVQAAFFMIAIVSNNLIEGRKFRELGYTREDFSGQFMWAGIIFVVLSAVFIGLPLLLGVRDMFGNADMLLLAVPYRFLVGFAEETLFRGYVLGALLRLKFPKIGAIIISSFLFGAWHFIGSGNVVQVLLTTLIGAIFAIGLVYAQRCTTLSIALAHGAYNATLSVLARVL
jgi:membrane protease YdiL (CAAX protease family)